ncbi:MAG: O-antigen ligase family protein [Patescibacteria group bacterium]
MPVNTTDKVLKGLLYLSLFAALFLPLFVANGMFFPFIVGKNFAFRIIVEIALAIWLILLSRKAITGPKSSWIVTTVAIFACVLILAAIFSVNPYRSFWSNYERMDGLINLLHVFGYFFLMASVFNTQKLWNWYLHTSLASATITSLIGLAQLTGLKAISQSSTRVDTTFGNATYLAVYMFFHIFIALYFFIKNRDLNKWHRIGYGALVLLYGLILYHTATRGAILGLIGGLIFALILSFFTTEGRMRKLIAAPLVLIVLFAGGFYLARDTKFVQGSPVLSRFSNMSLKDSTTRTRFIVWSMALKGVAERPILGWGQENFNIVFNKHYDARLHSQETWFDRAHNVFLDWLVAAGILGLAAYLSIFVALFWIIWKNTSSTVSRLERNLLAGLFAGYLFQNIFVFDNITSYIMFFSLLAYIHFISDREVSFNLVQRVRSLFARLGAFMSGAYRTIVYALVPVLAIFVIYFVNVKPIKANGLILTNMYPRVISEERLTSISKLFDMGTFGNMEAREQLLFLLIEVSGQQNVDQNLMMKYLELAYQQMSKQLESTGNDARHQLFMGSFLQTFGKADDALVNYKNAQVLSPKKQIILNSLSRVYLEKGDYAEAMRLSKEAYESDQSYSRGAIEYAITLIYAGENEAAEALFKKRFGTELVADPRVIQAYVHLGRYDKIIAIWKEQIADNPTNPQAYLSLAATYYADHQDTKAIQTLRQMIEVDPNTKAQAEEYIKQIESGTLPRN